MIHDSVVSFTPHSRLLCACLASHCQYESIVHEAERYVKPWSLHGVFLRCLQKLVQLQAVSHWCKSTSCTVSSIATHDENLAIRALLDRESLGENSTLWHGDLVLDKLALIGIHQVDVASLRPHVEKSLFTVLGHRVLLQNVDTFSFRLRGYCTRALIVIALWGLTLREWIAQHVGLHVWVQSWHKLWMVLFTSSSQSILNLTWHGAFRELQAPWCLLSDHI